MSKKKARRRNADSETVEQVEASGDELSAQERTAQERAELAALRRENKQLREDNEILQRARVFFARKTQ